MSGWNDAREARAYLATLRAQGVKDGSIPLGSSACCNERHERELIDLLWRARQSAMVAVATGFAEGAEAARLAHERDGNEDFAAACEGVRDAALRAAESYRKGGGPLR